MSDQVRDMRWDAKEAVGAAERYAEGVIDDTEKPALGEVGSIALSFNYMIRPFNPDDLVRSHGKGVRLYQEMAREPYIKAALLQKKGAVLSVPWDVIPASGSLRDAMIAEFVKWNFTTGIKGGLNRCLFAAMDCLNCGYSVAEIVWKIAEKGPYKGRFYIERIKSKDPYYYYFNYLDQYGNLEPNGLQVLGPEGRVPLPIDKFLIISYMMLYENHFGNSDLRAAYRAYWIKDTAWKLRGIYMERFSGNHLKGTYGPNDNAGKEKLLRIFQSFQQSTGLVLPRGLDVEVMNLATASQSEYERAIADLNKEICVGLLGETLTVDQGQKNSSSYALGQIHKDVTDIFVLFLDLMLTVDINEQLVRRLVDANYADVDAYPCWRWEGREGFDAFTYSQALNQLAAAGLKVPTSYIYKRFRIPPPRRGEAVLEKEVTPASPSPQKFAEDAQKGPRQNSGYWRPLTRFEKFAEIPRVDRRLKSLEDASIAASRKAYEQIFDGIAGQVQKKDILGRRDYDAAARIIVNPGPLKEPLFQAMLAASMAGRADAVTETQNQGFEFGHLRKFKEIIFDMAVLAAPLTPEEAVKHFSGKVPMTKEEWEALQERLRGEAFFAAGLEKTAIEKDVKPLIFDALKNGISLREFRHGLDELQVKYATPVYGREGTVGEKVLDYHAETVYRTNLMDAYNKGKRVIYDDKQLRPWFPAYQYSAIMDSRTCPMCRALDGFIALATDPIWDKIWPPNHFNDRCTVVSINKYDFHRDMLSPPPTVEPAEGFGGKER